MYKPISVLAKLLAIRGLATCSATFEKKADTVLIGVSLELNDRWY